MFLVKRGLGSVKLILTPNTIYAIVFCVYAWSQFTQVVVPTPWNTPPRIKPQQNEVVSCTHWFPPTQQAPSIIAPQSGTDEQFFVPSQIPPLFAQRVALVIEQFTLQPDPSLVSRQHLPRGVVVVVVDVVVVDVVVVVVVVVVGQGLSQVSPSVNTAPTALHPAAFVTEQLNVPPPVGVQQRPGGDVVVVVVDVVVVVGQGAGPSQLAPEVQMLPMKVQVD